MARKLSAVLLVMLLMLALATTPVMAAEVLTNDDVITGEVGTTVTAIAEDGLEVVITFFDISEKESEMVYTRAIKPNERMSGWVSLKLNSETEICTLDGVHDIYTIDCYNYGDNQVNGAVTFNIAGTRVSVDAGNGCQVNVNVQHRYWVKASANWYAASYNLKVNQWY